MKKILATTDFSANSWKAITYAYELSAKFGAELVILNAYTLPYSNQTVLLSMNEILRESAEEGLKEVLQRVHKELPAKNVTVTTKAVHGDLLVSVDLICESEQIDLVVMGTKGATGLKAALLGSNTANVIRNVEKPVIAVPESYQQGTISKVTLCADFADGMEKRINFSGLYAILRAFGADLHMLHVVDPYENNREKGDGEQPDLQPYFPGVNIHATYNYNEDVEDGIKEFVSDNQTDLLVMIRRNYNFIESLFHRSMTRSLAMHAEIPLLVLKEGNVA